MLFSALQRRLARQASEDLERTTLAVNNGLVITRDKEALRQFERRRAQRDGESRPAQTPREFTATLGRLAAMFPGAVRMA